MRESSEVGIPGEVISLVYNLSDKFTKHSLSQVCTFFYSYTKGLRLSNPYSFKEFSAEQKANALVEMLLLPLYDTKSVSKVLMSIWVKQLDNYREQWSTPLLFRLISTLLMLEMIEQFKLEEFIEYKQKWLVQSSKLWELLHASNPIISDSVKNIFLTRKGFPTQLPSLSSADINNLKVNCLSIAKLIIYPRIKNIRVSEFLFKSPTLNSLYLLHAWIILSPDYHLDWKRTNLFLTSLLNWLIFLEQHMVKHKSIYFVLCNIFKSIHLKLQNNTLMVLKEEFDDFLVDGGKFTSIITEAYDDLNGKSSMENKLKYLSAFAKETEAPWSVFSNILDTIKEPATCRELLAYILEQLKNIKLTSTEFTNYLKALEYMGNNIEDSELIDCILLIAPTNFIHHKLSYELISTLFNLAFSIKSEEAINDLLYKLFTLLDTSELIFCPGYILFSALCAHPNFKSTHYLTHWIEKIKAFVPEKIDWLCTQPSMESRHKTWMWIQACIFLDYKFQNLYASSWLEEYLQLKESNCSRWNSVEKYGLLNLIKFLKNDSWTMKVLHFSHPFSYHEVTLLLESFKDKTKIYDYFLSQKNYKNLYKLSDYEMELINIPAFLVTKSENIDIKISPSNPIVLSRDNECQPSLA